MKKVTVESSIALSDAQLKALTTKLEAALSDKVQIENRVDSELIAGIRIVSEGKVVDLTAASKLNQLKQNLLSA